MDAARTQSQLCYLSDPHAILSAVRDLIEQAERSILLQMYLFAANGDQTLLLERPGAFPYAKTVAQWLIDRKRRNPSLPIVVILDSNTPSNPRLTRRRGVPIRRILQREGIIVLNAFLFDTEFDRRPHFLPAMNLHLRRRAILAADWVEHQNRWQVLHNVEDHRKNLIIDGGRAAVITSHNFCDPSFDWHENMFWVVGDVAQKLWRTGMAAVSSALTLPQELTAADRTQLCELLREAASPRDAGAPLFPSGATIPRFPLPLGERRHVLDPDPRCALLPTRSIRGRILALLNDAASGDEVLVASAYFSDLAMLSALKSCVRRGARVRVLIDSLHALTLPHIPSWLARNLVNHAVIRQAREIQKRYPGRFELRIHQSQAGAMMHLKTVARIGQRSLLIGGQANFTPNSFSGAYLETDLETRARSVISGYLAHFERLWRLPASTPLSCHCGVLALLHAWFCTFLLWMFTRIGLRP